MKPKFDFRFKISKPYFKEGGLWCRVSIREWYYDFLFIKSFIGNFFGIGGNN